MSIIDIITQWNFHIDSSKDKQVLNVDDYYL